MTSDDARGPDDGDDGVTEATAADATALDATGMDTGSDAGSPGEREPVDPADPVAAAVQDDAPLPPEVGGPRAGAGGDEPGGPSGDGLDPAFTHP